MNSAAVATITPARKSETPKVEETKVKSSAEYLKEFNEFYNDKVEIKIEEKEEEKYEKEKELKEKELKKEEFVEEEFEEENWCWVSSRRYIIITINIIRFYRGKKMEWMSELISFSH